MNILVAGFSVLSDRFNPISYAKTNLGSEYSIRLLAFGGLFPDVLPYFLSKSIGARSTDILIIDINTPSFRKLEKFSLEYFSSLLHKYLEIAVYFDLSLAFLILPRKDISLPDPWLDVLVEFCDRYSIAYNREWFLYPDQLSAILRDVVHPNAEGQKLLGEAFMDLVKCRNFTSELHLASSLKSTVPPRTINFFHLCDGDNRTRKFSRSGYESDIVEFTRSIRFNVPHGIVVDALSFIVGPSTSSFNVLDDFGNLILTVRCFDEFCYYERLVVKFIDAGVLKAGQTYVVEVGERDKNIKLLKGAAADQYYEVLLDSLLVTNVTET